jgi:transcriptional regulator with XRE-family HTH domain
MSKILELRLQLGKTQTEIAKAVGCDRCTISRYERGLDGIQQLTKLKRLAAFLQCSLDDLIPSDGIGGFNE